jgi:hypothetical protein
VYCDGRDTASRLSVLTLGGANNDSYSKMIILKKQRRAPLAAALNDGFARKKDLRKN